LSNLMVPIGTEYSRAPAATCAPMATLTATERVWLAVYTSPRHEKTVARHLQVREVEHFLPLFKSRRNWKNGCRVEVEFPVFPNYVFVRTERERANRVLQVPGVVGFAGSGLLPSVLSDSEVHWLRNELPLRKFEPHPYLVAGSKVRILSGPLMGLCGVLVRKKNDLRVVLTVDLIHQSVAVEVDASEVESLRG